MDEAVEKLQEISGFFRKMNTKIKLAKLLDKAKLEYDKYDYNTAENILLQAYDSNPESATVLRGLGCLKQFTGDYNNAIEYYNKALKSSEAKEIEYTLLGTVYYLEENFEEAIKYFNMAIDINDNYDKAYETRNQAMLEYHLKIVDLQDALKKYF